MRSQYDLAKIRQSLLCSSEKIRVFGDFCKGHSWISQPKTKFKESSRKLGGRCRSLLNDLVPLGHEFSETNDRSGDLYRSRLRFGGRLWEGGSVKYHSVSQGGMGSILYHKINE